MIEMLIWLSANWINLILVAGLVLIVGLLLRGMIRNKKAGKSSCGCNCASCGACAGCASCARCSAASPAPNSKRAEEQDMIKTTLQVDGMMCSMCEAHICEAIRKAVPAAKKIAASRGKKEASFLTEAEIDTDRLKKAIDATGYVCLGVESAPYEKKHLFRQ